MARIDRVRLAALVDDHQARSDRARLPLLPPPAAAQEPPGRRHADRGRPARASPASSTSCRASSSATRRSCAPTTSWPSSTCGRSSGSSRSSSTPTSPASTRCCASPTTSRACTASRTASACTTRRSPGDEQASSSAGSPRPSRRSPAARSRCGGATTRTATRSSTCSPCDAAIATFWTSAYPVHALQPLPGQVLLRAGLRAGLLPGRVGLGAGRGDVALRASRASSTRPGWPRSTAPTATRRSASSRGVDTERYHPPARKPSDGRRAGQGLLLRAPVAAAQRVRARAGRARQASRSATATASRSSRPARRGTRAPTGSSTGSTQPRRAAAREVADLYRSCDIGLVLHAHQAPELPAARVHGLRDGHRHQRQPGDRVAAAPRRERARGAARRVAGRRADRPRRRGPRAAPRGCRTTALAEVRAARWEDQLERVWGAITKRGEPFETVELTAARRSMAPRG